MDGDHVYDDPVILREETARQAFLDLIPETLRAPFGGLVGRLVRKQLEDWSVDALYDLTLAACTDRAAKAKSQDEAQLFTFFEELVRARRREALGYLHWALWWDRLDEALKESIKARRWQDLQMALQPPTTAQVAYLHRLGHTGPITHMAHARRLIEEYIAAHAGRI